MGTENSKNLLSKDKKIVRVCSKSQSESYGTFWLTFK